MLYAALLVGATSTLCACSSDDDEPERTRLSATAATNSYCDFYTVNDGDTLCFKVTNAAEKTCEVVNPAKYVIKSSFGNLFFLNDENDYQEYMSHSYYTPYIISDIHATYSGDIVVPSQVAYNGETYTVTGIGEKAFEESGVTSVALPSSLIKIGDSAFSFAESLTSIALPEGLEEIGGGAFWGCSVLEEITIPSTVKMIGVETFDLCSNLRSINVASGNQCYVADDGVLYTADKKALMGYPAARAADHFTIPSTVDSLACFFIECRYLESVTVESNSIDDLSESWFDGSDKFASITVSSGNPYYTTEDGILYNKDKSELLFYPQAKAGSAFTVPQWVKTISSYAFEDCSNLESVTMQEGLDTLKQCVFRGCNALKTVTLPSSLVSISNYVFNECEQISDIYCHITAPYEIEADAFSEYDEPYKSATLHVPAGTKPLYQSTAGWSKFQNIEDDL